MTPLPGNYGKPVQIEVDVPDGCSVYYTMDKTEPTASSTRYEEPFWLPVGYSTFKFVTIAPDGVTGSVTECNYTLNLHPLLSMEMSRIEMAATSILLSMPLRSTIITIIFIGNITNQTEKAMRPETIMW